jgi:hypothetical protein
MNWLKLVGLALMFTISATGYAQDGKNFYFGMDAHYAKNSIGDQPADSEDFTMSALGIRAGAYIEPQLGIELYMAKGIESDEQSNIEMSLESVAGVVGRFESPETENGFKLYVLLGYGMTELEMQRKTTAVTDRELYHGFVYGGGGELRLGRSNSYLNVQGLRHYHDNGITLNGLSIGFRQGF